MDIEPGTVVANRYRISRPLGRGGMGEVFAAENIRTGRPVAVKLLRSDSKQKSSAVARFRREARAAGSINSDHVTQVLDVEEDQEHGIVIVFELLEGESLIDRLKRTGPIPFDELHGIIEQVWMGLADAHRAGIIHRDLKPSNVFLERRPDGLVRVKILDFGISKLPKEMGGETLTEMGQSLGTFSFMPPEQIGKAKLVDHRADIYACATMIYQALTGQLPYSARNILVMVEMKSKSDARKLAEALPGQQIDPRLEAFLQRGLARDPALRFQSAVEALMSWRELRASSGGPQRSASGQLAAVSNAAGSSPPPAAPQASARGITTTPMQSAGMASAISTAPSSVPTAPNKSTNGLDAPLPVRMDQVAPIAEMTTDSAATLALPKESNPMAFPVAAPTAQPAPASAVRTSQMQIPQRGMGGTLHLQNPSLPSVVERPPPDRSPEPRSSQPMIRNDASSSPYASSAGFAGQGWQEAQQQQAMQQQAMQQPPQQQQSPQQRTAPFLNLVPTAPRIVDEPTGGPNSSDQTTIYKPKKKQEEPPLSATMSDVRVPTNNTLPFVLGAVAFALVGFGVVAAVLHFFMP